MHALIPLVFADAGPTVRCLRSLYPLVAPDAPVTDVHVAMEGRWEGHSSGPFELTREAFAQIVANFERSANAIPLDFEHATEWAQEAPACGWVHGLEIRNDDRGKAHLWARVELGEKAARYIREGAYRFSSGVFVFDARDNATGADIGVEMTSLALTNVPFILGQTPIALSRRAAQTRTQTRFLTRSRDMKVSKEALLAALGALEMDELSPAEVEAAMGMAAAQSGALAEEEPEAMADEPKPEDEEEDAEKAATADVPAAPVQAAEPVGEAPAAAALAPLMEATGMDLPALAAAVMENLDAVAKALSGALQEPAADAPLSDKATALALSTRDAIIRALSETSRELAAWKAEREAEDADRDVATLVDAGFILADAREDWKALRLSDRKAFDKLAARLTPAIPLGAHASARTPQPQPSADIDEAAPAVVALRRHMTAAGIPRATQDDTIKRQLAAK